ncbi:hypothetical protein [Streptomyces marincola]|uniref:Uncharacterized protein n=1 Tax=Streptomyces marincola TaxID=2878388 RepID=A0A1W7CV28_9ACTN|nr:hypothetical protein [Streptomyces marincola]ARQ68529.1 hypothetical protein CAG99_06375 [Streptomyces marincola]
MPNISITYADVDAAAVAMKAANDNVIRPASDAAKGAVDDALANHLIMPQTGTVLNQKFTEFHQQLTELINNIDSFADQFVKIKEGMQDLDEQMANNLNNPPAA